MLIIPVIRTDEEYRKAWEYLVLSRSLGYENPHLVMLKRDIRMYNRNRLERHFISDDGIDGYTEKIALPSSVTSLADAEEWFEREEYCEARPSQYDCTGQKFTLTYRIAQKSDNRWYVYHTVRFDV